MEDNLNIMQMEDDLNFVVNVTQLILLINGRLIIFLFKRKMTSNIIFKMEDNLFYQVNLA